VLVLVRVMCRESLQPITRPMVIWVLLAFSVWAWTGAASSSAATKNSVIFLAVVY
jgi:hypothetical protein